MLVKVFVYHYPGVGAGLSEIKTTTKCRLVDLVDILSNELTIVFGRSVFVLVLLCITLCPF